MMGVTQKQHKVENVEFAGCLHFTSSCKQCSQSSFQSYVRESGAVIWWCCTCTMSSRVRRKSSWGEFVQGHMVVTCIWCALFVTSQF